MLLRQAAMEEDPELLLILHVDMPLVLEHTRVFSAALQGHRGSCLLSWDLQL